MNRREFNKMAAAGLLGLGVSPILKGRNAAGSYAATLIGKGKSRKPIDIGSRRELFVDDILVERVNKIEFRLHHPTELPPPKSPLIGGYTTVLKDGALYRAYFRDRKPGYEGTTGREGEITCYAESLDGHEWTYPDLGILNVDSPRGKNVILDHPAFSHNFTPFMDTRPGVDKAQRFKAIAGRRSTGLHLFASGDGLHWDNMYDHPVVTSDRFGFDSQNVCFWSEEEQVYHCYFRVWTWNEPNDHPKASSMSPRGLRTISRSSSPDLVQWSEPVAMDPNLPGEHLYTNNTQSYSRAPHIFIALPTRYVAGRVGMEKRYPMSGSTDILFMTQRAGSDAYTRQFKEAFIRPGFDPRRWENRANYVALNVVPTSDKELSIYHNRGGHRYVLRTDGFVSARAGAEEGELLTKPLTFRGERLIANYSTSAAGYLGVEIQDTAGNPLPGLSLQECERVVGDTIDGQITWKSNPDLKALAGRPVRLRFVMADCDVYSFRFLT